MITTPSSFGCTESDKRGAVKRLSGAQIDKDTDNFLPV
jgi:hypothetical protein